MSDFHLSLGYKPCTLPYIPRLYLIHKRSDIDIAPFVRAPGHMGTEHICRFQCYLAGTHFRSFKSDAFYFSIENNRSAHPIIPLSLCATQTAAWPMMRSPFSAVASFASSKRFLSDFSSASERPRTAGS